MPATPPTPFTLRHASRSDVGMRRANNQDSLSVTPLSGAAATIGEAFLMIADGMGAHAAGELASSIATDTVPQAFLKSRLSAPAALRQAIREANRRIHEKGCSAHEFAGMGTTCSCLAFSARAVMVGHVGDSRVYRLRGGKLEQLTFDHSLVWEMAAASNVSEDRVPSCIPKNVITRSLGPNETVNVDLEGPHELRDGDAFLLCSDGLTGVVDDPLAASLIDTLDPEEAAQTLVDVANLRGGPDNISVIVAKVSDGQPATRPRKRREEGTAFRTAAIFAAIAAVAVLWSLAFGPPAALIVSAILCAASFAVALASTGASAEPFADRVMGGPYGNGPYRTVDALNLRATAEQLRGLVEQLAEVCLAASADGGPDQPPEAVIGVAPNFDWSPVQPLQDRANAAFDADDYAAALLGYSDTIRRLMQLIREDDGTHRYRAADSAAKK